nr:hypothetical protein BaRGS_029188 [Batillaria attramentaria]
MIMIMMMMEVLTQVVWAGIGMMESLVWGSGDCLTKTLRADVYDASNKGSVSAHLTTVPNLQEFCWAAARV